MTATHKAAVCSCDKCHTCHSKCTSVPNSSSMKKPQLFLLHFAGGNCYSFQFMIPLLKDFEVICLELPGRGKRINEPLVKDFDLAANDIFRQLQEKLTSSSFLIYGHSMGAYLALRVSKLLESIGKSPAYLVVSGNAGPGVSDEKRRYLLGKDEFIKELKSIGGIPDEVFEHEELFDFFEPVLRADFEIAETNHKVNESVVNIPIYAMMGNEEEKVDNISNWARFSTVAFNYEILEGDHFFIHRYPERVATVIKDCYNGVALLQHQ